MIDLLHELAVDTSEDIFPRPVINRLGELLEAGNAGFCELPTSNWDGYYIRTLAEPDWFGEVLFQWSHQDALTCKRFANSPDPVAVSDVLSRAAAERLELYQYTLRPFGFVETAKLFLPAAPGEVRFFFFDRERWGLTKRERELLVLLRPHLVLHRSRRHSKSSELRFLTRRELEVLEAVAAGRTNTQIAEMLWISPYTVRNHLEHIFDKLGVRTRTEAAARLYPAMTSHSRHGQS